VQSVAKQPMPLASTSNKKAAVTPLSFHQTSVMFKPSCYDLFKLQSLMINCQQKYDGDRLLETFNE